jgi:hypothetical protein
MYESIMWHAAFPVNIFLSIGSDNYTHTHTHR